MPGAGGSWAAPANWDTASVPNAIGAAVFFTSPTAARTVTNDSGAAGFTVGSLSFDITANLSNSLTTGTAGSNLKLNNGGAGVTITTSGGGTANNSISVALVFNDSVTAIVNQTSATSGAGSLNITSAITGSGGFTKLGDGLATFGTGTKTFTGPMVISGGRMRSSLLAAPTGTSGLTINAGGQLTLITTGSYTFGSNPMKLNGNGATSVPFSVFPGAIRNDTNVAVTINNQVVLESNTLLHVEGTATGSLTFPNAISGAGSLTLAAPSSSANQGQLVLGGGNSYMGGTFVNGGTLVASGSGASFGAGDVTVNNALSPASTAKLTIQTGVLNAIADTATLSLAGGGTIGLADNNYIELQNGVNEFVSALLLGGVPQAFGTYGSTASGATFQNDEYFSGPGVVTVVPEPGAAVMLLGGIGTLLGLRRRNSRRA